MYRALTDSGFRKGVADSCAVVYEGLIKTAVLGFCYFMVEVFVGSIARRYSRIDAMIPMAPRDTLKSS